MQQTIKRETDMLRHARTTSQHGDCRTFWSVAGLVWLLTLAPLLPTTGQANSVYGLPPGPDPDPDPNGPSWACCKPLPPSAIASRGKSGSAERYALVGGFSNVNCFPVFFLNQKSTTTLSEEGVYQGDTNEFEINYEFEIRRDPDDGSYHPVAGTGNGRSFQSQTGYGPLGTTQWVITNQAGWWEWEYESDPPDWQYFIYETILDDRVYTHQNNPFEQGTGGGLIWTNYTVSNHVTLNTWYRLTSWVPYGSIVTGGTLEEIVELTNEVTPPIAAAKANAAAAAWPGWSTGAVAEAEITINGLHVSASVGEFLLAVPRSETGTNKLKYVTHTFESRKDPADGCSTKVVVTPNTVIVDIPPGTGTLLYSNVLMAPDPVLPVYKTRIVLSEVCLLEADSPCATTCGPNAPPGAYSVYNGTSSGDRLSGVGFEAGLGQGTDGAGLGLLSLRESRPSIALASPAALHAEINHPGAEVDRDGSGVLQQIRAPQALVNVAVSNSFKYALHFYQAQTNGTYLTNDPPFVSFTIENPAATTTNVNHLRITETRGQQHVTNDFLWSDADQGWTLTSGNGLRAERKWQESSSTNLFKVHLEIIDPAIPSLVSESTSQYQIFTWGAGLIGQVKGTPGTAAAQTNSYAYTTAGQLEQTLNWNGSWEKHTYNSSGLLERTYSAFGNQGPTTTASACRTTDYSYASPAGSGDDSSVHLWNPRSVVESVLGQEVSRSWFLYTTNQTWEIRSQTPGAAWNAADNLVTLTTVVTNGAFFGRTASVSHPDGSLTLYDYSLDENTNTVTTIWQGVPGGQGTNVVEGTQQILVSTPVGTLLTRVTKDIATGITTASETYSDFDVFGRPGRVTYLDGSFKLTDYICCGISSETAPDGTTTSYTYDDLKRRTSVTRPGPTGGNLTQIMVYDANGNVLQTIQQGTDSSQIIPQTAVFNTAGQMTSMADALTNTTTVAETINGSGELVRTTTLPNGATRIETHYRDGSLKTLTGTAVHGVRYEYGKEADGLGNTSAFTKEIKLDATGADTSEWVKSYTDMLGRNYLTKYPDGASSRQYYNTLGQLWKSVDPDGVTRLYQYNALGEQEYTAVDLNQNDTIDFSGTDQITRSVRSVGTATAAGLASGNAHIGETYQWTTDSANTSLLLSRSESLVDGTGSAQTSLGLTSYSWHSCGGSCEATNLAPDGTYSVTLKTNGYAIQMTRYDSNHTVIASTHLGYDPHGRQHAVTNFLGWGSTGNLPVPAGDSPAVQVSLTTHDLLGRPVITVRGAGTSLAQTNIHYYDSVGQLWRNVEPDGSSVTNEFFATGQTKKTYGTRTYPVEYTYDYAGRMKTMVTWQDFAGNGGAAVTTWNYHSQRGWLANKRYADNQGPDYTYTAAGRLATRQWARTVGGTRLTTTYTHDNAGQLTGVDYSDTTPDVTTTYDRRGRQVAAASSSGNSTLTYNDAGQLTGEAHTAGLLSGLTVTNTYDALFHRSSLALGGTSYASPTYYTYDAASRLLSVSDGTNSATYSYLANSHLVSNIVFQQASTTRMTTSKQHDNLGRLTSIGSVSSVSSVVSSAYAYNTANQRTAITNADGSYWLYGYDTLGQVTSGKRYWADNTPVAGQQFEYGFDDIGNRRTASAGGDASGANLRQASYNANTLNQYTSRTVPPYVEVQGTAATNATVTVNNQATYRKGEYFRKELAALNADQPVWLGITNLAVVNDGSNPDIVTTNQGHLFLGKTPEVFTHDADGNMRENGEWKFTWDGENRMVSAETSFAAAAAGRPRQKVDWTYLHDGRWGQRVVSEWSGGAWVAQATSRFVWDGVVLLAVLDGNNQVVQSYLRGLDLSGSPTGAGGTGGLLAVSNHQSQTGVHFVAFDGNGNVSALIDASYGTESARYEYSPFGETLRASGPMAAVNLLRFSTQFTDEVTGHVKFRYRHYVPAMGCWSTADPLAERGGINLFGFVGNTPPSGIDYLGLKIFSVVAKTSILEPVSGGTPPPGRWAELQIVINAVQAMIEDDPEDGTFDGTYRFAARKDFDVSCCGNNLSGSGSGISLDTGTEGFVMPPPAELWHEITWKSGNCLNFKWLVRGRPHPTAEYLHGLIAPRTSFYIWHLVDGSICCKNGQPELRGKISGSKFPTHLLYKREDRAPWQKIDEVPQGVFMDLWTPHPTLPGWVQ